MGDSQHSPKPANAGRTAIYHTEADQPQGEGRVSIVLPLLADRGGGAAVVNFRLIMDFFTGYLSEPKPTLVLYYTAERGLNLPGG